MKRILAVILAMLVCLAVAGCGTDSQSRSTPVTGTDSTPPVEEMDTAVPQLQEITAYLEGRQPYYRGTTTVNDEYRFKIMNYHLALGEERLIEQYIACLIVDYDVSLGDIYSSSHGNVEYTYYYLTFGGDSQKFFGHDDMDHQVSVSVATYPDTAEVEVTIGYAEGFEFVDDGHRSDYSKVVLVPTPTPNPTPTPTPVPVATPAPEPAQPVQTVDRNAAPVPEFSVFLNRWPSEEKDKYYGGNRKYYQKIPLETQKTVVAEILALLDTDRYQLELIEKVDAGNRTDYNYRYTGNVAMDSIHSKNDDTRYYNLQFTVYNRYNDNGTYGIHFHYSPQFVEENAGYKVSVNISNGGSTSGGTVPDFEGGDLPDAAKLECLTCHGSKDCKSCDGKGYKIKDDIRSDCTRCTSGDCPACGGTGTRS